MYFQPHNMIDQVYFSLSSFKHPSIFFMQKGESVQTKTQPQYKIVSKFLLLHKIQLHLYCIRRLVCLDKISTQTRVYTSKNLSKWKLRFKSTIRSLASQNIVPYNQTHKSDKQSGQRGLHCFANQINSKKGVQSLSIFYFAHGGRSGRDRHMQLVPVTTKVVSVNLLMARYTRYII